jgi:uncharacterized protein (TIGR02266 family)
MDDSEPGGAERRAHPRVEARFEVHFRHVQDAARALRAYSVNVSTGGLCLRVRKVYAVGDPVGITLQVASERFELMGAVAWVRTDAEAVGVRFVDVSEEDRQRLERVVDTLRR